jgi:predicted Fe-S protein YdhL (DUF1289 family)
MNTAEQTVASPCINVCVLDEPSGLCAGCYRTLGEIAAWMELSAAERRAIIDELPFRRATHGAAIAQRLVVHAKR